MLQEIALVVGGVAGGGLLVWWLVRQKTNNQPSETGAFQLLEQTMANHLRQMSEMVDRRLQENARAVSDSEQSVRAVVKSLGRLEQATTTLQHANDEIISFQHLLTHPKIRGSFGEVLLGNLLGEVLPQDRYELQYIFPHSREIADAIIHLQDGHLVTVDAKFPLANYLLVADATDEITKSQAKKMFVRDVKKHISDIARKYINPQHKTLDYAFMYIPIEGVYYETMVGDPDGNSLWEFCLANKVIPVSPNSFLAYLHTILIGLRGMKIEEQAKDIVRYLSQIRQDMLTFSKDFTMIGTHLVNAKNRYDDSTRRLDRLTNRLEEIDSETYQALPEKENPA